MTDKPNIIPINIEDEIRNSYLDYAMSVIIGRALPDVRDGLKPVHRRILFAQHELGNRWNASYKKSARVVGDVIGKYHPHGDSAVYDALVRLAQPWNMRTPLIDGQGNFGSVDGDSAAAMRYTEVRMSKITQEFLGDINKNTVAWGPNYDDSMKEPLVLPTKVPNLLINGSSGIAVGMSTNIPPHNPTEVIDAVIRLIDQPETDILELMKIIPGPDFPTAGKIYGAMGIKKAYHTGRGIVRMRAKMDIETDPKGRLKIVVTELPFQVNKARLIEKIADLVRDKRLEGIRDLRDESDRDGMRMVIELKRDAVPEIIINNLFKMTAMQSSFGIIMLAIVNGQPKVMNIKEVLEHFIDFRRDVVTKRTVFELDQALARAHILEGFKIALDNLDAVITLIRASKTPAIAKEGLISNFALSTIQAQGILEMRLQKLTGLERDKIISELEEIQVEIARLRGILADDITMMRVIKEELVEMRALYPSERLTEIIYDVTEIGMEDLIAEETMVVTITHQGYVKRTPVADYRAQRRGGKGRRGMSTKEEDFVEEMFVSSTHTAILVFTSKGKVYKRKVYELPLGSPTTKGKPFVQILPFAEGEKVRAVLQINEFDEAETFIVTATKNGVVKRTELIQYQNVNKSGIIALKLKEGDELDTVKLSRTGDWIFLASRTGQSIRFEQSKARAMGRTSAGVFGMRFKSDTDTLASMDVIPKDFDPGMKLLTITSNGYGKRTDIDEYSVQGRGGTGNITIKTTDRNGEVVGARLVGPNDEIMLITDHGQIIRTRVSEISVIGRNTQGVRIMNTDDNEHIVSFARIKEADLDRDAENEAEEIEVDVEKIAIAGPEDATLEMDRSEEEE